MITKDELIKFYRVRMGDLFKVVFVTISSAFIWAVHILPKDVFMGVNKGLFYVVFAKYPLTMLALSIGYFPLVNHILRMERFRITFREYVFMLPSLLLIIAVAFVYA